MAFKKETDFNAADCQLEADEYYRCWVMKLERKLDQLDKRQDLSRMIVTIGAASAAAGYPEAFRVADEKLAKENLDSLYGKTAKVDKR